GDSVPPVEGGRARSPKDPRPLPTKEPDVYAFTYSKSKPLRVVTDTQTRRAPLLNLAELTFPLAARAEVAGAIHEPLAHDGRAAAVARFAFPTVRVQGACEVAAAAVDIHVQLVETGPSGLQGSLHHGSGLPQDGVRPALA